MSTVLLLRDIYTSFRQQKRLVLDRHFVGYIFSNIFQTMHDILYAVLPVWVHIFFLLVSVSYSSTAVLESCNGYYIVPCIFLFIYGEVNHLLLLFGSVSM